MLSIKIENGQAILSFDKRRKLTPKQLAMLSYLRKNYSSSDEQQYLASLLGLIKEKIYLPRRRMTSMTQDPLAVKTKGSVLSMFQDLMKNGSDADHRPSSRSLGKWLGVEIECFIPHDGSFDDDYIDDAESDAHSSLARKISRAGIPRVSVKSDGSLNCSDGFGVEITILFNSSDGFEPLFKLCEVLNREGCYVNKSCGLHVHFDARHMNIGQVKSMGQRLGKALPLLKYIVDKSRHNNTYCKLSTSRCKRGATRYHAINLTSFFRYKTVEVRLHGGSTNAEKIKNWIELLQFIASTSVPKSFVTFQQLLDLGLPDHLVEYAEQRITKLNPEYWAMLEAPPVVRLGA